MSMIYTIQQATDGTIDALLDNPRLVTSFISGEKPPPPKRPGFIARLFGAPTAAHEETAVEPIQFETGDDICLDKAWHGLHYLLTQSDWEGDPPEAFLLNWGTEIGTIDVGYGPARAFRATETNEIHKCLAQLDTQTLRVRFNPSKMMELDIYPTIWDRDPNEDDTLGYVMDAFERLRVFVGKTCQLKYGMVAHLG